MTAVQDDFTRRLDRDPLDANSLADRYQSFRARQELLTTLHQCLCDGLDNGVTGTDLEALITSMHDEFRSFLNTYSWDDRKDLNRFPAGYPTPWLLGGLHHDLEELAAAGGRSPAAVYRDAPETSVTGLSQSARAVARALGDSDMAVQPLKILDDARGYGPLGSRSIEGPFDAEPPRRDHRAREVARRRSQEGRQVLRAVALAAHYSGSRVLAIPVTEAARTAARTQRYAHHVAEDERAATEKLATGVWRPPPGALIIVDDADELVPDDLRQLTKLAGATNTKLILVTADRAGLGPDDPTDSRIIDSWNRASRERTDVLHYRLPWNQHVGETGDYRLCATAADAPGRVKRYLSGLAAIPADIGHRHAAEILSAHDSLTTAYTDLAAPVQSRGIGGEQPGRDVGLCL
jgi:hypothetical protein